MLSLVSAERLASDFHVRHWCSHLWHQFWFIFTPRQALALWPPSFAFIAAWQKSAWLSDKRHLRCLASRSLALKTYPRRKVVRLWVSSVSSAFDVDVRTGPSNSFVHGYCEASSVAHEELLNRDYVLSRISIMTLETIMLAEKRVSKRIAPIKSHAQSKPNTGGSIWKDRFLTFFRGSHLCFDQGQPPKVKRHPKRCIPQKTQAWPMSAQSSLRQWLPGQASFMWWLERLKPGVLLISVFFFFFFLNLFFVFLFWALGDYPFSSRVFERHA